MVSMPHETMLFPFGKSSYPIASSQESKKEEIETGFQMIKKKLLKVDEKRNSSKEVESSPNSTFDELEQQIEVAETRCDTLKQQLGYMKMLYQGVEGMNIAEVHQAKPKKSKPSKRHKSSPSCVTKTPSNTVVEEREEQVRQPERDVLPIVKETVSVIFEDNETSAVSESTKNEHSGDGSGDATKEETVKAVDVINDILTDMNASVGRIAELSDTQKKSKHLKKQQHLHTLSAKVEQYLSGVMQQQGKAWGEDVQQEPSSPENKEDVSSSSAAVARNSMSETYFGNDQKEETHVHSKATRHEGGHRSKMFTAHATESADSLRNKKRKAKRIRREKKANAISAYAEKFCSGADDAASIIMKARKKAGKVRKTDSRKTVAYKADNQPYELDGGGKRLRESKSKKNFEVLREKLSSDRIIELYHNAAIKPKEVVSDVNFVKTRKRSKHTKRDVLQDTSTSFACVEEDCVKESEDDETLRMANVKNVPVEVECKVIPERTEVKEIQSEWNCTRSATQEDVMSTPEKKPCPPSAVSTSRGRRLGKSVLPKCNFRNIPFVVGKSTTPSHHLGLNIQQALSIIKMRHPVSGLPPMTIAQEFLRCSRDDVYGSQKKSARSQPVSAFLSRISSCTGQQSCCPALALQQLPDVPEKDESVDKFRDLDTEPQQEGAWAPVVGRPRCTCFPARPCVDYQKLLAQYLEPAHTRSLHADTDMVPCKDTSQEEVKVASEDNITCAKYDNHLSCQLKCVLLNIHNDLIRLNKKCNELQNILNNERDAVTDKEVLKELEILKKELQAKENDIMILMHLYEEVQRLKDQTKVILERISSQNVAIPKIDKAAIQEPTTSMRLAKLLRNIQQFQEKLRQE